MSLKRIIIDYFIRHKLKLILVILFVLLSALFAIIPAQILRYFVDDILPSKDVNKIFIASIIYVLSYVCLGIVNFINSYIMLNTSQYITAELRIKMMQHVEKLSYNLLVNTSSGSIESYFNNDVNSINELFTSGVIDMISDIFKMIMIAISIFVYSYVFGIILIVILPFLVLFTSFIRKRMLKAQLRTKNLEGDINKFLLESIENAEQVKVNKANKYVLTRYNKVLLSHFKVNQASNLYDAIFSPFMQLVRNIVICVVLLLTGYKNDIFGMSIGMVISSISLLTDLFTPIENIGMEIQTIQKSLAAIKRINSFLIMEETNDNDISFNSNNFDIVYDNVYFAYEKEDVISNFSLKINQGDKLTLKGPSGVGKSTLMKLAMGLLKPSKGKVSIGGIDTYRLDDESRKKLFAIVYQDPFFSNGTIYEEVSLLDENISKQEVRQALNQVGLDYIDDIDKILIPNEYSSGELALFNIARVIVRNPKIIFLDEMNSKIDPYTAHNIIELINKISKDKIVISISHYGELLDKAKVIEMTKTDL